MLMSNVTLFECTESLLAKATDDHQTSENWEVIISLCDKVIDEGESGCVSLPILLTNLAPNLYRFCSARNVVAAILKRLAHRTSNVQLYALSLAEALEKNCTIELHRELASKSFTQGLEKLITDRVLHVPQLRPLQ
jgi:signal transducing adaptor molecule